MKMLNTITIMGRLTKDVELRASANGKAVASFTVAVDRDYSAGEQKTDFINCVAFDKNGEFVARNFSKGKFIVVNGRLQIRNYTDKDGNKRSAAEVVSTTNYFGGDKKADEGSTMNKRAESAAELPDHNDDGLSYSGEWNFTEDDSALPF